MFLFSVINGHEHIELFKDAPRLLSYLKDAKVEKAFLHKSEPANKSSIFAELKKGPSVVYVSSNTMAQITDHLERANMPDALLGGYKCIPFVPPILNSITPHKKQIDSGYSSQIASLNLKITRRKLKTLS